MMYKLLLFLILSPVMVAGQFSDDFSDGDFSNNPSWQGNTQKFTINEDFELQLTDDEESTAFLSVNQQRVDSTEWLFDAELQFLPSGNNNARIYLAANSANPELITKAVFLQMGESGSDDALTLFYQNGDEDSVICRGSAGLISSSFSLSVKVTYRNPGVWRVFIDPLNNGNYVLEAEGSYPLSFSSSSFIVFCKYTISNSEDFIFDNFMVRPFQLDVTPPEVDDLVVTSSNSLQVVFSEPLSESGAVNTMNYLLNGSAHPDEVIIDDVLKDNVTLTFEDSFENNTSYDLLISGVEDIQGNVMNPHTETFTYLIPYEPQRHELIINELMVDVNPEPSGLPAYDYLELYNTTQRLMDLGACVIQWSSYERVIPEGTTLMPGHFLMLTDEDAGFSPDIPVLTFSSLPLNTEAALVFRNANQQIIHALDYQKDWYHDEEKEDGGWSLEMIDPNNPCGAIENFMASNDADGGTPGRVNAVFASNPDEIQPVLSQLAFSSDSILSLVFSETMDTAALKNPENYQLFPQEARPEEVLISAPFYQDVQLVFENTVFIEDTKYVLQMDSLIDCAGNHLQNPEYHFSTYNPGFADVLITEVMADVNPEPLGLPAIEYLEIYNNTPYSIDLSGWILLTNEKENEIPQGSTLNPEGYLVLTEQDAGFDNEVVVSGLSITNDGAEIALLNNEGSIIHFLDYSRSWMLDPLKSEGGWSVEMIDNENICGQHNNWKASGNQDGGTPGAGNSVAAQNPDQAHPDVLRIAALSENSIRVYFDELMSHASLENKEAYSIEPSLAVEEVNVGFPSSKAVDLVFDEPMSSSNNYRLSISGEVTDCVENTVLIAEDVFFAFPFPADTGDVVINEVLFNAGDNNEDFVEIYNVSENAIDLSSMFLLLRDPVTNQLEKKVAIADEKLILLSHSCLALSRDEKKLAAFYPDAPERNLLSVEGFPSLPSSEGKLVVQSTGNNTLDILTYHEDMHFGLLNDDQDVSLERIDPYASSSDRENWHSASQESGFATPGAVNSQHFSSEISDDQISVSPKIITPDNDGRDDVASININLQDAGYSANIRIFDARGRAVVVLKNNYLLGSENNLFWDGTNQNHEVVNSGYYIIYIELFDLNGNVQRFKKTVVVSSK